MHASQKLAAAAGVGRIAPAAPAQTFSIPWHTIDCGGGTASGGSFTLSGTIGQHDAGGSMTGGDFSLTGGFWAGAVGEPCIGDFNRDGAVNTLDVLAFLNAWSAQDPAADCDGNGEIDTRDVLCFLNAWSEGCP